jgi:hypothetical protein
MPKLDLVNAAQIRSQAGEWLQAKGQGWSWARPAFDPFPAALLAASGPYVHYAAEDAGGAFWQSRHGLPLEVDRAGTPALQTVGGVQYLACTNGCYDVVRTPFPAESAFSLWSLTGGNRPSGKDFYIGPPIYANSGGTLQFYSSSRVDAGASRFNVTWELPATAGPESLEWARPMGGSTGLSRYDFRHNNTSVVKVMGDERSTRADGDTIVLGGARNSSGVSVPGGTLIRDVVLTIGWTLNSEQRAAMEAYRLARIAPPAA